MLEPVSSAKPSIAVIGISANEDRPSHYVSQYMQRNGYHIYPINPALEIVLGEKVYRSLSELPVKPDIVNVFRAANFIPAIVDEMLKLDLRQIWVQQGIVELDAARTAEAGGIRVVMDRCIMIEHGRMYGR